MKKDNYIRKWFRDFWGTATYELKEIFSDSGALLIFLVAGLLYPLLYNIVYLNGLLEDTPLAVVDHSQSEFSRRYIREVDATRECSTAFFCPDMQEARKLMEERKAYGILYFPSDYEEKLRRNETATLSVYCDMSSFLYYKNALMGVNHVLLEEMSLLQKEDELMKFIPYEENNPYNRAFSYNIFLISVILMIIVQQTLFYGMALLTGTHREQGRSFAGLKGKMHRYWTGRVVLGRGAAYWILYLGIATYILTIVPAIFGMPQRGNFYDVFFLILIFITDCVFFSMTWSALATRRESVFILFLFLSPVCVFLTGTSWPVSAFPEGWKWFSYLFPSTFGCKAYVNISTAGGTLTTNGEYILDMTLQTIIYFILANLATYLESIRRTQNGHFLSE